MPSFGIISVFGDSYKHDGLGCRTWTAYGCASIPVFAAREQGTFRASCLDFFFFFFFLYFGLSAVPPLK